MGDSPWIIAGDALQITPAKHNQLGCSHYCCCQRVRGDVAEEQGLLCCNSRDQLVYGEDCICNTITGFTAPTQRFGQRVRLRNPNIYNLHFVHARCDAATIISICRAAWYCAVHSPRTSQHSRGPQATRVGGLHTACCCKVFVLLALMGPLQDVMSSVV